MRTIGVGLSTVSLLHQSFITLDGRLSIGEEWHLAGTKERKVSPLH